MHTWKWQAFGADYNYAGEILSDYRNHTHNAVAWAYDFASEWLSEEDRKAIASWLALNRCTII